jgi:hypothetical protein
MRREEMRREQGETWTAGCASSDQLPQLGSIS